MNPLDATDWYSEAVAMLDSIRSVEMVVCEKCGCGIPRGLIGLYSQHRIHCVDYDGLQMLPERAA